jgi:class 3 adenylate cyclase
MPWLDITIPTETNLLVGFYDLTGYMRLSDQIDDKSLLEHKSGYFDFTGGIIEAEGGLFLKAMGDAGLADFQSEDAEWGVGAFLWVKAEGDQWLREHGLMIVAVVKIHLGPVMLGLVGSPLRKRIDIYGKTVNTAALLGSKGFAMSPQVFRKLGPESRKRFKKHTPPVTYIAARERH